jgi:hypothetical protein
MSESVQMCESTQIHRNHPLEIRAVVKLSAYTVSAEDICTRNANLQSFRLVCINGDDLLVALLLDINLAAQFRGLFA